MNIDVLINQIDDHNESSIIATKKFNPESVLFIYKEDNKGLLDSLKKYYNNFLPNIKFKSLLIKNGDILALSKIINENKNKKIIVNLTGGSRVNSLQLLNLCIENSIQSIYVDIKNKNLYMFDNEVRVIEEEFEELKLDKLVKASGGELINDSTDLANNEALVILTKAIYKNLSTWHKYKQKLYDPNIFLHDSQISKTIRINLKLLNKEEEKLLEKILNELKKIGGIEYHNEENKIIKVEFQNEYLKSFIF